MKLTVPLYQEKFRKDGNDVFYVRPLFFDNVESSRAELRRATDSVRNSLRKMIHGMAAEQRHDQLAWAAQCPEITDRQVKVRIQLKRRNIEASFLFCVYEQNGMRLAFTPRLPRLMFELARGDDLKERASEVLSAYYRKLERELDSVDPHLDAVRGSGWVSYLDLNVAIEPVHVAPVKKDKAEIGSFQQMRGADELHKVGRQLNALFPDDLQRAVRRDELVTELERLLDHNDKRPLLLLGRSGVGKTALIHEAVYRRMGTGQQRDSAVDAQQVRDRRSGVPRVL